MNKKIGILTGGGDCPGLNALIRAVVKSAIHKQGWQAVGILDGFEGLLWPGRHTKLSYDKVSEILTFGGTILGSSNRIDPFHVKEEKGGGINTSDRSGEVVRVIKRLGLDVLFVSGGDGTMTIASGINALGVPVIGMPKTIDNDLRGTDFTIGFDTAVTIASEAIDRLRTTAQSHHRVMVVEVMGRNAGWIALESGIASGADIVLIPEIPFSLESICRAIDLRSRKGRRYTIVVVAEGASLKGGKQVVQREVKTSAEPIRLGGIGEVVTHEIESRTGIETRVTVLGHVQRGGTPTARDRNLATLFGIEAVRAAAEGETGIYVALKGNKVTRLPLRQAAQGIRRVSLNCAQVLAARAIGMRFGNE